MKKMRGKIMDNKSSFNRELSAEMILQDFVNAYTHGRSITDVYEKFINKINDDTKSENRENNSQRRKILEKCRDLFKDLSKKKEVEQRISFFREEAIKNTGTQPTDSEITRMLLQSFSDSIWGDDKRKYNMSSLATTGSVTTVKFYPYKNTDKKEDEVDSEPYNSTEKDEKPPHIIISNKYGDSIYIEYLGYLHYETLSSDEYIYKHRICRKVDDNENTYEIYSNIDINELAENKELRYVVFTELLSKNNIENSYSDGYIGEISNTSKSPKQLQVGEESETDGFYRYQVTSNYALEYDGEKIEAIRAYKQQEANKSEMKDASNNDER